MTCQIFKQIDTNQDEIVEIGGFFDHMTKNYHLIVHTMVHNLNKDKKVQDPIFKIILSILVKLASSQMSSWFNSGISVHSLG